MLARWMHSERNSVSTQSLTFDCALQSGVLLSGLVHRRERPFAQLLSDLLSRHTMQSAGGVGSDVGGPSSRDWRVCCLSRGG